MSVAVVKIIKKTPRRTQEKNVEASIESLEEVLQFSSFQFIRDKNLYRHSKHTIYEESIDKSEMYKIKKINKEVGMANPLLFL